MVRGRLRAAVSREVLRVAIPTALVVGTVLNLINHGRGMIEDPAGVAWWAVGLNYLVPYLVSTWSASAMRG